MSAPNGPTHDEIVEALERAVMDIPRLREFTTEESIKRESGDFPRLSRCVEAGVAYMEATTTIAPSIVRLLLVRLGSGTEMKPSGHSPTSGFSSVEVSVGGVYSGLQ